MKKRGQKLQIPKGVHSVDYYLQSKPSFIHKKESRRKLGSIRSWSELGEPLKKVSHSLFFLYRKLFTTFPN